MEKNTFDTVIEVLSSEIRNLKLDIYLKDAEIERLNAEKAELVRQRDALCRRDGQDGVL